MTDCQGHETRHFVPIHGGRLKKHSFSRRYKRPSKFELSDQRGVLVFVLVFCSFVSMKLKMQDQCLMVKQGMLVYVLLFIFKWE